MEKEKITDQDLWKDIAKAYTKLGHKLDELNRMYKKLAQKNEKIN